MASETSTPPSSRTRPVLWVTGAILLLFGLFLLIGGVWLLALGGSWYYAIAGLAFLLTSWLTITRRPEALWVYAAIVAATLAWAVFEVGFDWWRLAPRGGVIVLLGLWLLVPWVTRALVPRFADTPPAAWRGGGLALSLVLVASVAVAIASMFNDPHAVRGEITAAAEAGGADTAGSLPPGEWHSYGRTDRGQRYSPLAAITPENVERLEVAWHYHTGDVRQPGDTEETTYEVTPLKIGDLLYLCTPHDLAIALDAATGEERWRFDPNIKPSQSRQHQTCRGLSYYEVPALADAASATSPPRETGAGEASPSRTFSYNARRAALQECPRRVYLPTADARLIALSAVDGQVCTTFGNDGAIDLSANMPHWQPGFYYSTSPPVIADGVLVVGGAVNDNVSTTEPSGVIRGYDPVTGQLLWNWDSGNPGATAPIGPDETYTENSPNAWSVLSADADLGLVFAPLGNAPPDQFGGNRSAEVERFSSSVVALDIRTGELKWVFQTVHHDLWDYDVPAQPTLVDLAINGETVPALAQATKQGEIFVLDRRTGEPLLPVEERPAPQGAAEGDHTEPTQPVSALSFDPPPLTGSDMWGATMFDQLACRVMFQRLRYEGRFTPPSTQGTLVYPGNFGVFNWGGIAVDPERRMVFATPAYLAFVSKLIPRENATENYVSQGDPGINENYGAPYAADLHPFTSPIGIPCQQPPWGYVAGADLTTGKVAWMHKNGTVRDRTPLSLPFRLGVPGIGGPMMTAGGVAFYSGNVDNYVRAFDVTNGNLLWEARLPAGGQATPMTYEADGRQYVVVVAGGHGSTGTEAGDSIIAYALPES
jgi:quinoprotein glucose dehydrogenase